VLHNICAIESELARLGLTQNMLAALTEIPARSLSDIVRTVKPATFEQTQTIFKTLEAIDRLVQTATPMPLDLRKTRAGVAIA
jgi:hypothetical protein